MERTDLELIQQWKERDPELNRLWTEHLEFEEQLARYAKRVYLTSEEQMERKKLQKKKLQGRDQIERILLKIKKGA